MIILYVFLALGSVAGTALVFVLEVWPVCRGAMLLLTTALVIGAYIGFRRQRIFERAEEAQIDVLGRGKDWMEESKWSSRKGGLDHYSRIWQQWLATRYALRDLQCRRGRQSETALP